MDAAGVREFALSSGFDMTGICDPAALNPPPEFDWAKSLVVLGYATLDETLDAYMRIEFEGKRKWSKWIYEIIAARALRLCIKLMEKGFKAVATKRPDLVRAGVVAGLGSRGRNNLLVTRNFGPRVRLISVATDAELEFDGPFEKELCRDCDLCIRACPTEAFTPEGFDRKRCIAEFSPGEELAKRQRSMLKYLTHFVRIQCVDCMVSCPIGRGVELKRPGQER